MSREEALVPGVAPETLQRAQWRTRISDLASLGKPKILVLLLITTGCPMLMPRGADISFSLVIWTLLGGALMSASAGALNCVIDRDIDAIMRRTSNRPLAAGRLSLAMALGFAAVSGVIGLGVLLLYVNSLAAALSLFGHFFYVVVYSLGLKRRTPQNIVIGGAAGAVPPMVGMAAVSGAVDLSAVLLFAVVFLWTPPHFWALALNKNEDYQKAGIPMLPVISGWHHTRQQMLFYAALLLPVSLALVWSSQVLGGFSVVVFSLLGLAFLYRVYSIPDSGFTPGSEREAWKTFGFSIVYLAVFFLDLVIDSTII